MIRITAPWFVAGVVFNDMEHGIVVQAAPIVKYMHGWTAEQVKAYCRKRRWTWSAWYEPIGPRPTTPDVDRTG